MDKAMEQLFTNASGAKDRMGEKLSGFMLLGIGIIDEVGEDGKAIVREYIDNPLEVYIEHHGVEVLLPAGVTCPIEGCLCILLSPRTPIIAKEMSLLVGEGPYSSAAIKAIPVKLFNTEQGYGAGYKSESGFSLYTPFGSVYADETGIGLSYADEDEDGNSIKASIDISEDGIVNIANGSARVTVDKDGVINIQAIGEDDITDIEITADTTKLKRFTNDDNEDTLLDVTTDKDGNIHIEASVNSNNNKQNTIDINADGITVEDVNDNKVEMTQSGIKETVGNNYIEITSDHVYAKGPSGTLEVM